MIHSKIMERKTMTTIIDQVVDLENTLKCTVCDKIFEDPVFFNQCSHTFCKKCVSDQCDCCPTCKISIDPKSQLQATQIRDIIPLLKKLKGLLGELTDDKIDEMADISDDAVPREFSEEPETPMADTVLNGTNHLTNATQLAPKTNGTILPKKTPQRSGRKRKALTSPMKFKNHSPFRSPRPNNSLLKNPKISNLEKKNTKGETPLHVSVIKGDIKKVKDLLKLKANPNVKDYAGWTPLHEASNHGYLEIAKLLLHHGAIVNVPGENNITPLHDAVLNGKLDMALLLVSKGADISARTSMGLTALDLCETDEDRTALEEAHVRFLSGNVAMSEKVILRDKSKVVILSTSLDDSERDTLVKCAKVIKAEVVENFGPEVTHMVSSVNEDGQCNRTRKILQAILLGKWIVSFEWVEVCLEYKKKVLEEGFEIPGTKHQPNTHAPKLSRQNAMKQCPPLFDGCYFYLYGQFSPPMPTKEELIDLVQMGGGQLVTREPKEDTVSFDPHRIPYHAADGPFQEISHFILYQEKPPRIIQTEHICSVNVMWFIESVCAFKLLDIDRTQ